MFAASRWLPFSSCIWSFIWRCEMELSNVQQLLTRLGIDSVENLTQDTFCGITRKLEGELGLFCGPLSNTVAVATILMVLCRCELLYIWNVLVQITLTLHDVILCKKNRTCRKKYNNSPTMCKGRMTWRPAIPFLTSLKMPRYCIMDINVDFCSLFQKWFDSSKCRSV